MTRTCSASAFFMALAVGCSSNDKLPPLYPVKGHVVKNGVPLKGGSVSFLRLNDQTPLIVIGDVDDAGSFELGTVQGRKKIPGAPAGEYHVTYNPSVLGKNTLPVTPAKKFAVAAGPTEVRIDLAAGE